MVYLESFSFPDAERETSFIMGEKRTVYDSFYPFKILSSRGLEHIDFEPITVLYGGNGSGKTTVINVIAEKLGVRRDTPFNSSPFFGHYVKMCRYESRRRIPDESRVVASDDVFDYMLNIRALNQGIDTRREEIFTEYLDAKYSDFKYRTMEDYERLVQVNSARRKTQSRYVRDNLMDNAPERSNGESAFFCFTEIIKENALYLLDEPENSLSPDRQIELAEFIANSARFFGCQFIISTHSPFMLAMPGTKIYDLDADPAAVRRWTELKAVRKYYDFFMEHSSEFD